MKVKHKMTTRWGLNLFSRLRNGGVWGIPRSGVVFQKQKDDLVWVGSVPPNGSLALPVDAYVVQESEFLTAREKFAEVGILVTKAAVIEKFENMDEATARWEDSKS
ncbi:MAG TPA: hypothetical protein VGH47_04240 [Xanthobacteraceae bacterium]|jgi:hypothetical protein